MGVKSTRVLAVALLLIGAGLGLAHADTFVVAGAKLPSPVSCVFTQDEVYAPLLTALPALKASSIVSDEMIVITTGGGREVSISRRRPEATVDGEMHTLPTVPRLQGDDLLFPAKAVGALLGCAVRWDNTTRTVYLNPMVRTFTVETTPDLYRVTIGAEQPLSYRVSTMEKPPRIVVDVANAELAEPFAPYRVENSYFHGARVAQHALAPDPKGDVVRLVVDLSEWKPYRVRQSDDHCQLRIECSLPDRALPSDAPPVTISDFTFRRYSDQLGFALLATSGKAQVTSGTTEDPATIWVDIENAQAQLAPDRLAVTDALIKEVTLAPAPDRPEAQRLTLALAQVTPYAVTSENNQVRIAVGRCELSNLTVVVDAGHGGGDTGAVGRSGLTEKEVTLDIALRVGKLLEEAGAKVVFTRSDDTVVRPLNGNGNGSRRDQLLTRCDVANSLPADLFVSVHCNANASHARRGTETYYRKFDSLPFARAMQEEVAQALGLPDGGALHHPKPIIVLYRTEMPAVLVEVAYLSNRQDEALLSEDSFRQQAAQGIANGIKRYVTQSDLLSSLLRRHDIQLESHGAGAVETPGHAS